MRISAALPAGVTALMFEAAARRRELESRLVGPLEAAGFSEVVLPILDYAAPYESLRPAAQRDEVYRFVGRDGELLALRSDFTPLLARLLAPRLASLALPLRLYYRGDVVRCEEARAGRLREFYQLGAELLGVPGEEAERAMLALFLELMSASVAGAHVVLGFAGALDHLLLRAQDPGALAAAVERRERQPAAQAGRALREIVESGVPRRPAELGSAAGERLARLIALRDELAVRYPRVSLSVDLAEFARQALLPELQVAAGPRGYYDGLVFRAFAGASGVPVGGGGRYDRLFRRLGAEVAAVGFSLGVDRLPASPSPPTAGDVP
jgi:ATP phosphoribosyltransferase regulatory subunit